MRDSEDDGGADFSSVPDETVHEFHRQGELMLQGTVQLATAMDQRATTSSGIMAGGAVALLTAAAAMSVADQPFHAFVWSAVATAVPLFVGAVLCAWAARPTAFFVAGYEPRKLLPAVRDKAWMLRFAAEDIQVRITANRRALESSSRLLGWGMGVGLLAAPVGAVVFVTLSR